MPPQLQIRSAVESELRKAFHGVTLGRGMSLNQAQFFDGFPDLSTHSVPGHQGITHDWSRVSLDELELDCVAHLDALGFRYYIPALMLSVLDNYDSSSMRVIGTLGGLYPKKNDGSWEYHMHRYSLLSPAQKAAIARFLRDLSGHPKPANEGQLKTGQR
jgi:hypothetical protein